MWTRHMFSYSSSISKIGNFLCERFRSSGRYTWTLYADFVNNKTVTQFYGANVLKVRGNSRFVLEDLLSAVFCVGSHFFNANCFLFHFAQFGHDDIEAIVSDRMFSLTN